MGMLLGVLSRCSGVPRGSQEAQWVNLVTKKFVYSSDIVVGFENFEIGQKTKKLAPTAPDWGYPVGAQECPEVVRSAQWVNLVKKKLLTVFTRCCAPEFASAPFGFYLLNLQLNLGV